MLLETTSRNLNTDKLHETKCTQSEINRIVAGMLGEPHIANQPNEIKDSPYVLRIWPDIDVSDQTAKSS